MFGNIRTGAHTLCGCWYVTSQPQWGMQKSYLPLLDLSSKTTILATTSRSRLTQTFHNPKPEKLAEVQYTFPLYDGVSVVSFKCVVAGRTIVGIVKEKQQARADYKEAIDRGETAGILEQIPEASDAFTTKIGNVPANEQVVVEIEYLGELKHDAETDGSRFTIPTNIAPRYGSMSSDTQRTLGSTPNASGGRIEILVDITVEEGSAIRGVQSPSHPIAVSMGRMSSTIDEDAFDSHHASATLTLGSAELDKDFVIVVLAKGQETPRALLETHPTLPNHRALMTTLVPKFNLPAIHPEIVFVVDRSGSMGGKMAMLISAMRVFLKSLPISVKFNICSFGSHFDFMFKKSKTYDQSSLADALARISKFDANYGGTEMYPAVKGTIKNRFKDMPLEIILLTDGEIWNQQELFELINKASKEESVRVFSLGIGSGASSSLVEGVARAGDGFAQFVDDNERMDKRVVRMLKGALTPHIKDYKLEVKYHNTPTEAGDDFEMIEKVDSSLQDIVLGLQKPPPPYEKKTISLFDTSTKEEPTNPPAGKYDHLPTIATPSILQAPNKIPSLYPFNRTTVYLLLGPNSCQKQPKSVILRGTSEHGPLELEIQVQDVGVGQTIHQLAAKKAVHELEQGRGWLVDAKADNKLLKSQYKGRWDEIVEREAVHLGLQFQVGGKWCSFVAVEKNGQEDVTVSQDWEKPELEGMLYHDSCRSRRSGGMAQVSRASPGGGFGSAMACQVASPDGAPTLPKASMRASSGSKSESPSAPFQLRYSSAGLLGNTSASRDRAPTGGFFDNDASTDASLFGNPPTGRRPVGLFGGTAPATGGLFGNSTVSSGPAPTSNSLFGGNHPKGSGLFSVDTAASGPNPTNRSSLFENNARTASGLFGDSAASSGPAPTSVLFGNNPVSMFSKDETARERLLSSQSVQQKTSLFGANNTLAASGSTGEFFGANPFAANSPLLHHFPWAGATPPAFSPVSSSTTPADSPIVSMLSGQELADDGVAAGKSANHGFSAITNAFALPFSKKPAPPAPAGQGLASMAVASYSAAPQLRMSQSQQKQSISYEKMETQSVDLDFSSLDNSDVVENFDFDRFGESVEGKHKMSKEQQLHGLINLQNFDGSWDWTLGLQGILNLTLTKVHQLFAEKEKKMQTMLQATVLAIAFLEVNMADEEETWEMVVEKAKTWLMGTVGGAEEEIKIVKASLAAKA